MDLITQDISIDGRAVKLSTDQPLYVEEIRTTDWGNIRLVQLARGLPNGSTMLDVGANIGATAVSVAAACPSLKVIAFEPVPLNNQILRANVAQNGLSNCATVHAAVGDKPGMINMSGHGPWATVSDTPGDIPVITLDGYCAKHLPNTQISLIKIDVEGYEPNVLAGATETIRRWKPIIFLELNSWTLVMQGYSPIAFANALMESFDVEGVSSERWDDGLALAHANMTGGCVSDLVMRPRADFKAITPNDARFDAGVGAELAAIKTSTSWRITAPIRAVKMAVTR